MSEYSGARLESRIMETISTLIVSGQIKNPHLSSFTSVTRVELASDNSNAIVYVTSYMDDKKLDESVNALNSAAAFIQGKLAKIIKTRNTPVLKFKADNSFREGEKVNELIEKVMTTQK